MLLSYGDETQPAPQAPVSTFASVFGVFISNTIALVFLWIFFTGTLFFRKCCHEKRCMCVPQ